MRFQRLTRLVLPPQASPFRHFESRDKPHQHPALHSPARSCGEFDMAATGDVEQKATRREELRQSLITSSTKRRTTELSGLQNRIADNCECST
jgi:hypothetical protein